jgi:hypothetical protein
VRGDDRKGAERRSVNRFFVVGGAWGVSGDSWLPGCWLFSLLALGLKARERASGETGESDLRSWKREGFDGERERERRSCEMEET